MNETWTILQENLPQALADTAYMVVVSGVVGVAPFRRAMSPSAPALTATLASASATEAC